MEERIESEGVQERDATDPTTGDDKKGRLIEADDNKGRLIEALIIVLANVMVRREDQSQRIYLAIL